MDNRLPPYACKIPCPHCGDIIKNKNGEGCETCGFTGYMIMEAVEVL